MAKVKNLNLDKITPNPYQPRQEFDDEQLNALAASIREKGLIQPIVVRETDDGYQIIAGERRWRACRLLGMSEIKAIVRDAGDEEMAELALIENLQREDLSPIEEAQAYQTLLLSTGMTQVQLADRLGRSQSALANKLRLLTLSQPVQDALRARQITERHGRALLDLDAGQQEQLLAKIIGQNWTVRRTEQAAEKLKAEPASVKPDRRGKDRCYGVNTRIAVNTIRAAYDSLIKVNVPAEWEQQDAGDRTILKITIKK